jgi:hypothetical protein
MDWQNEAKLFNEFNVRRVAQLGIANVPEPFLT